MVFSRREYWSGQPSPSPGDLPNPGIKPRSPAEQADSLPAEPQGKPKSQSSSPNKYNILRSLHKVLSPSRGNGNYSCLENPMDGGAWQATVHGVAKSQTGLSDFTSLQNKRQQAVFKFYNKTVITVTFLCVVKIHSQETILKSCLYSSDSFVLCSMLN